MHNGLVKTQDDLKDWLQTLINNGPMRNDMILLAQSWRLAKAGKPCNEVANLAIALGGSAERHLELTAQGSAFVLAVENWPFETSPDFGGLHPLPVVVGGYCGVGDIDLESALIGYLQAFVTNQLQAAIRLSVLGQSGAAQILATLEADIARMAAFCSQSTLDDLGSATINADIASMNHETQTVRLFRS
ncbi:MAG: urease accessory protein UreF [Hyphomicrobiales bacterium]|nr:MAG: urease accessory protein UreF [Hyphomicrobiales bacterium]